MKTSKKFTACCLSALLAVAAYGAESSLTHGDHSFVEKAAKSGMEEVSISRVAVDRAQDPQVKEFAQMMVSDHTDANTQLTNLATTDGVMLPVDSTNIDKWSKRSAKDFDEEYISKMVSDHKEAVELFEKESKNGTDADLKAFAMKTLPTLQAHLEKAELLKKSMK
jgi:putative membrane protein